jgi:hypothetical protein
MEIPIHSQTDLITNSSTTIYTYSDQSPEACREMINEIFKTFGINKTCDDVFDLIITLDNYWHYSYYINRCDEDEDEDEYLDPDVDKLTKPNPLSGFKDRKRIEELFKLVAAGKIEKPEWMNEAEKHSYENGYGGSVMHILPKAPEYEKLAKLVSNFLYSTTAEESSS